LIICVAQWVDDIVAYVWMILHFCQTRTRKPDCIFQIISKLGNILYCFNYY